MSEKSPRMQTTSPPLDLIMTRLTLHCSQPAVHLTQAVSVVLGLNAVPVAVAPLHGDLAVQSTARHVGRIVLHQARLQFQD